MADRRTLILMRHATAGHQGATRDHDRPLTERGRLEATDAGRWLHASLPAVDAVLCSTATRTRQTLAAAGIQAPVDYRDELYGGGVNDIFELLAGVPSSAGTVLVIGHAPGIPATAATLAESARHTGTENDTEASGSDPGSASDTGEEALRRFPAATVAVLSVAAPWSDIADAGADLVTVRLPD